MTRSPSERTGKTRLRSSLAIDGIDDLATALLRDTVEVVQRARGARLAVVYTPATSAAEFHDLIPGCWLLPQRGQDLGQRMHGAFLDLFAGGAPGAILVGSDLPTLPLAHLETALEALAECRDPVVIGPASDGGYCLIGLKNAHEELFENIRWGTEHVLMETLEAAARAGLELRTLTAWYDVDTGGDLRRALDDAARSSAARHTRRWFDGAPPEVRARVLAARS